MPEKLIKIKYIDKDPMNLAGLGGKPQRVVEGDVLEFPSQMAEAFLRDTKTVLKEKKKAKTDKDGKVIEPATHETTEVPKWERVEEKGGK